MADTNELIDVCTDLIRLVEGVGCKDWRDQDGNRFKDTNEWVRAYVAINNARKESREQATQPADAALAENAAIDCLRACAQAMRIFDRTDTAAEVDRATDAIAAALRARTVPVMFPRQTNGDGGWTIDTNYIAAIRKDCPVEWQPCEEETEAVLLAVERERAMLAASKEDGK